MSAGEPYSWPSDNGHLPATETRQLCVIKHVRCIGAAVDAASVDGTERPKLPFGDEPLPAATLTDLSTLATSVVSQPMHNVEQLLVRVNFSLRSLRTLPVDSSRRSRATVDGDTNPASIVADVIARAGNFADPT